MKNDSMEEVSVIIPTYNRIDSLRRTFSYLEKSKLKPLEVLITDTNTLWCRGRFERNLYPSGKAFIDSSAECWYENVKRRSVGIYG